MPISVDKLNNRHHRILNLCLQGLTGVQIAAELEMSQASISTIINSPSFKHEMAKRRERLSSMLDERIASNENNVAQSLRAGAIAAANKLVRGIESEDEGIALRSSSEVLDRAGFPKVSRLDTVGKMQHSFVASPEDAERIAKALLLVEEAGKNSLTSK